MFWIPSVRHTSIRTPKAPLGCRCSAPCLEIQVESTGTWWYGPLIIMRKSHCTSRFTTIAPQRLPKPVEVVNPTAKKVKLLHEPPAAVVPAVPDFFQSLQLHSVPVTVRAHGDEYTAVAAVGLLFSNGRRHPDQVAVFVYVLIAMWSFF